MGIKGEYCIDQYGENRDKKHFNNIVKQSGFRIYRKKYENIFLQKLGHLKNSKTCSDISFSLDLAL